MRNRMMIASLVLLALFGAGYAVNRLFLEPGDSAAPEPERTLATHAPSAPPVLAEAQEPEGPSGAVLVGVEGRVTRTDAEGRIVEALVGQTVPFGGAVQTEQGTATFDLAESRVQLFGGSIARIESLEDGLGQLRLEAGRVSADASEGLRLSFAGSDAIAEVHDGEVSAITDGVGQVAVTTGRGVVSFTAEGETVQIREGEESTVRASRPPSTPRRVPSSFFLRVRRPERETRERLARIEGSTTAGSVVRINGQVAVVDARGRFRAQLTLREGRNQVEVDAQDAHGRRELDSYPVIVDSHASAIESDVSW